MKVIPINILYALHAFLCLRPPVQDNCVLNRCFILYGQLSDVAHFIRLAVIKMTLCEDMAIRSMTFYC